MNAKIWGMLLTLSIVWGGSFFFNAILVRDFGPITIAFGRTCIASIALLVVLLARGIRIPRSGTLWKQFAIMGFLNNLVPFSLIAWGQQTVDSGLASVLNATMPLFTVLLAFLLIGERLTGNKVTGILLGLAGVIVLIGPDAMSGLGEDLFAQLAVVGAAISYALAAIFGRRFKSLPSLIPAFGMLTCTAILSLPLALVTEQFWTVRPQPGTWLALIGLGVVSTAMGYVLYFKILEAAGPTNMSVVTLLMPMSALLLGIVFLDEELTTALLIGMALIVCGLVSVDGRVFRIRKAKVRQAKE